MSHMRRWNVRLAALVAVGMAVSLGFVIGIQSSAAQETYAPDSSLIRVHNVTTEVSAGDGGGDEEGDPASILSFSHAVDPELRNRMLLVAVATEHRDTSSVVCAESSVTYGGVALTQADSTVAFNFNTRRDCASLWYLLDSDISDAANATLSVTWPVAVRHRAVSAITLANTPQQAPADTATTVIQLTSSIQTPITIPEGGVAIDLVLSGLESVEQTPNAGQEALVTAHNSSSSMGVSIASTSGSATLGWSQTDSQRMLHVVVALGAPVELTVETIQTFDFELSRPHPFPVDDGATWEVYQEGILVASLTNGESVELTGTRDQDNTIAIALTDRSAGDTGPYTTHWVCEVGNYVNNDQATLTVVPEDDGSTVCTFQQVLPQVTWEMAAGWNALTFTGGSGTPTENLAAAIGGSVIGIHRYDAATLAWHSFIVGAPAFLNTLTTVNQRDPLFIQIAVGTSTFNFTTADFVPHGGAARTVQVVEGSQIFGWTGPFATPAGTLFTGDLDATPIFKWDAATQGWISFQPGLPAAVNGFLTVNRLDIVSISGPPGGSGQVIWPEAWPVE